MDFKIGDKVTRNSYNNDIIFIITDIIDNTCYFFQLPGKPMP